MHSFHYGSEQLIKNEIIKLLITNGKLLYDIDKDKIHEIIPDVLCKAIKRFSGNLENLFFHVGVDLTNPLIQTGLGYLYKCGVADTTLHYTNWIKNGDLIKKDLQKAIYWYEKLINVPNNHLELLNILSKCYHDLGEAYELGFGYPKDPKAAFECYLKGESYSHDSLSQRSIGRCFEYGIGTPQSTVEALVWYKKAAMQNCQVAQFYVGLCYERGIGCQAEAKEAIGWYEKAADKQYSPAQFHLGLCYENGVGVAKDEKLALNCFQKSAENKNVDACKKLNHLYLNNAVIKNEKSAFEWIERAALTDNAEAQNLLGWHYEKGIGTPVNYHQAIKYYLAAAKQNYEKAKVNIAACYLHGRGVPLDPCAAMVWCAQINLEFITQQERQEHWFGIAVLLKLMNYFYSQYSINNLIKRTREKNPALTSIDLSYVRLDNSKMQELVNLIPYENKITKLNLKYTFADDDKVIRPFLDKLMNITEIDLSGNRLDSLNIWGLRLLNCLRVVNLSDNRIDSFDQVIYSLESSSKSCSHLNLSYNEIANMAAFYKYEPYRIRIGLFSADLSTMKKLKAIDLGNNKISHFDVNKFKENRQNIILTNLNLQGNEISTEKLKEIHEVLKFRTDYVAIGNALYKKLQFEEAKKYYERGVEQNSQNDQAHFGLYCVNFDLEDYKSALVSINEVIKIFPHANYKYDRAKVLFQIGDYQAALADFEVYLKMDPRNIDCLHQKAEALCALRQFEKSWVCYDQILKIDSHDDVRCYEGKIKCFRGAGYLLDALGCVDYLLSGDQSNKKYLQQKFEILNMYLERNNITHFMKDYGRIIKSYLGFSDNKNQFLILIQFMIYLDQAFMNDAVFQKSLNETLDKTIENQNAFRTKYLNYLQSRDNEYPHEIKMSGATYQDLVLAKQKVFIHQLTKTMMFFNKELDKFNKKDNYSLDFVSRGLLSVSNLLLQLKMEYQEYKEEAEKAEKEAYNSSSKYDRHYSQFSSSLSEYNQSIKNYNEHYSSSHDSYEEVERVTRLKNHARSVMTDNEYELSKVVNTSYDSKIEKIKADSKSQLTKSQFTWKQFLLESFTEMKNKLESLQAEIKMNCQYTAAESAPQDESDEKPQQNGLDEEVDAAPFPAEAKQSQPITIPKAAFFQPLQTDIIKQLMTSIKNNEEKTIHHIITTHENLSAIINTNIGQWDATRKGWTLLHLACELGRNQVVEGLMSLNADLNIINEQGQTPLHIAVMYKHADLAEMLIDFGADTTITNAEGLTAQQLAAESDRNLEGSLEELISRNKDWATAANKH